MEVNKPEREILTDFLFNRSEKFYNKDAENRRLSLTLLLDLTEKLQDTKYAFVAGSGGVNTFLECSYTNALPDYSGWDTDGSGLSANKTHWRQYYANELLSFAVQSLFWAGLTKLASGGVLLPSGSAYGKWFADSFAGSLEYQESKSFASVLENTANRLPRMEDSTDELHEIDLARQIDDAVRDENSEDNLEAVVGNSVKLIMTLAARWTNEDWKSEFSIKLAPDYQRNYPINLHSFLRHAEADWLDKTVFEWLAWLAAEWNVETHLQIALRKLRYETSDKLKLVDTFKILPTEQGLEVIDTPAPGFTNPRLRQSLQILLDLGIIKSDEDGGLALTVFGKEVLEANRNG